MTTDSPLKSQSLDEFGAYMTKEKVAKALDIGTHNIPVLVRAGLLKPLGHPQRYCVKRFSRAQLARNLADENWLDKAAAAIHRHWRIKNARKRAKQAGNSSPKETQDSESVSR
jgi:hypothetical protein